MGVREVKTDLK